MNKPKLGQEWVTKATSVDGPDLIGDPARREKAEASTPQKPTDEDRAHLLTAMRDTEEGWKLHPFTCMRFRALGWLDDSGWTSAAYAMRRELRGAKP